MIDYIIYGEFDINEGNVVKVEYPRKTGISEMVLASYLIPEGTHNIMNDCFCFIINRKENYEDSIVSSAKSFIDSVNSNIVKYVDLKGVDSEKTYQLKKVYNYNFNKWESFIEGSSTLKIKKDQTQNYYNIVISDKKDEVILTMYNYLK
jgi:hypothetical protein